MKPTEFLKAWRPEGPWLLCTIHPDRKEFKAKAFTDLGEAEHWIEERNGKVNLYFLVNSVIHATDTKPARENIASMDWLHVDIDPRAGEDLKTEQGRILGRLTNQLPKAVPPPTCIVFSGGGYQAYWKLDEPVPLDGKEDAFEEAKRYNQQLEVAFGADSCHNVDRIMRLPGTTNLPTAKKAAVGREVAESFVFDWSPDRVYSISEFKKAPKTQRLTDGFEKTSITVSGNIKRLDSLSELAEYDVTDRVQRIIAQGHDPDNPKKGDNSRNVWVFDVVCELVRKKVPDEVIFSIITDPNFAISESVIEKRGNMEKYALRQITRAKEHAIDPRLAEMNERFAVVANLGGRCRVIEEVLDPNTGRLKLIEQSFDDFKNRFMHVKVKIGETEKGPKYAPLGQWWLQHPDRMQYERVVFAPNRDIPGTYNKWKGFDCEAIPGDCDLFLHHVRENICEGNEEYYQYLLGWMARAVQRPNEQGEVAIVLQGEAGVGKSLFAKEFGTLFGRHFMEVANADHLTGRFNGALEGAVVVFADEAFFARDPSHRSVLKSMITSDLVMVEKKYRDGEQEANHIHLIMASNDDHVIPAMEHERRFFMLKAKSANRQDKIFFGKVRKQMQHEGGREALLHMLLHHDLTGFNHREVPNTGGLQEQKLLSLSNEGQWWYEVLQDGELPSGAAWGDMITKDALVSMYLTYMDKRRANYRSAATALFMYLKRACPGLKPSRRRMPVEGRARSQLRPVALLPTLEEARRQFEKFMGDGPIDWSLEIEQLGAGEEPRDDEVV